MGRRLACMISKMNISHFIAAESTYLLALSPKQHNELGKELRYELDKPNHSKFGDGHHEIAVREPSKYVEGQIHYHHLVRTSQPIEHLHNSKVLSKNETKELRTMQKHYANFYRTAWRNALQSCNLPLTKFDKDLLRISRTTIRVADCHYLDYLFKIGMHSKDCLLFKIGIGFTKLIETRFFTDEIKSMFKRKPKESKNGIQTIPDSAYANKVEEEADSKTQCEVEWNEEFEVEDEV
jgi:hypothetical protein